jgi:GAF domain-containing protein
MITADRLAQVFVEVADSLVDDFDLIDFLHTVASRAAELSGRAEAGLVLADEQGRLHHMGSSHPGARLLELVQLQDEQGPCRDCFLTGVTVVEPDLAEAAERWPTFAPLAVEAGFSWVHAFPMRLRDRVIGALNVFGREPGGLDVEVAGVVQALADVATIALIHEQAIARADMVNEQLQAALNSRIAVEQAKGAVAASLGVDVSDAFELMRRYARSARMPLTDHAHDLLRQPERIREVLADVPRSGRPPE